MFFLISLTSLFCFMFFLYLGLYKDTPICTFKTANGVTQVEFSPCGTKLYSAVRRNNEFLCWDLRNPGVLLYSFQKRKADTNQKIQFDITNNGHHVISGIIYQ